MSERPTPETDKAKCKFTSLFGDDEDAYWVPLKLARCLERERDEALERVKHLTYASIEAETAKTISELDKTTTMSVIDDTIDKVITEKNEAIAKLEWWRNEAESWKTKAIELDAQLESTVAKLTARISRIESNIKQLKNDY